MESARENLLSDIMSNKVLDKMVDVVYNVFMFHATNVSIRDVLRNHKEVISRVKKKKARITVVSQQEPQVGIVSLEDLARLEELDKQEKYQQSTKSLLEVARKVREVLKDETLPTDLSVKHDEYHYR